MERETRNSKDAERYDFEGHESDEMTADELAEMQFGADFFSTEELAVLMPVEKPRRRAFRTETVVIVRYKTLAAKVKVHKTHRGPFRDRSGTNTATGNANRGKVA